MAEERKAVMKVTSGALENEGEREMRVKYSTWKVALDGPSLLTSARQKHTFPGSSNWNQCHSSVVDVKMITGKNVITLHSKDSGPHIDMIYFTEPIFKLGS